MNNKFEIENGNEKLFKKCLLDRTLHKNTGLNLCFSLYIRSHCIRFHIKKLSLLNAKLKKYFCPSFPENKLLSSTRHAHIHFKF